jgi:hypothetical protein
MAIHKKVTLMYGDGPKNKLIKRIGVNVNGIELYILKEQQKDFDRNREFNITPVIEVGGKFVFSWYNLPRTIELLDTKKEEFMTFMTVMQDV